MGFGVAGLGFRLQPLAFLGAPCLTLPLVTYHSVCYELCGPALSWQEWKAELKDLTKLLHRAEGPRGAEADLWEDAAEEAARKLQMLYGRGAEKRHYEELLRLKPRGRIPTSRTITLKAEEVMSMFSLL